MKHRSDHTLTNHRCRRLLLTRRPSSDLFYMQTGLCCMPQSTVHQIHRYNHRSHRSQNYKGFLWNYHSETFCARTVSRSRPMMVVVAAHWLQFLVTERNFCLHHLLAASLAPGRTKILPAQKGVLLPARSMKENSFFGSSAWQYELSLWYVVVCKLCWKFDSAVHYYCIPKHKDIGIFAAPCGLGSSKKKKGACVGLRIAKLNKETHKERIVKRWSIKADRSPSCRIDNVYI